jgi:hypothetical protein
MYHFDTENQVTNLTPQGKGEIPEMVEFLFLARRKPALTNDRIFISIGWNILWKFLTGNCDRVSQSYYPRWRLAGCWRQWRKYQNLALAELCASTSQLIVK